MESCFNHLMQSRRKPLHSYSHLLWFLFSVFLGFGPLDYSPWNREGKKKKGHRKPLYAYKRQKFNKEGNNKTLSYIANILCAICSSSWLVFPLKKEPTVTTDVLEIENHDHEDPSLFRPFNILHVAINPSTNICRIFV